LKEEKMIDALLTDEQKMFRQTLRDFGEKEIRPQVQAYREKKEFPWPIIRKMAELGALGVTIPIAYGGTEAGAMGVVIVLEEVNRAGMSAPLTHMGAARNISEFACHELKQKYLPPLASGEKIAAYAQTEPFAGSDAAAMRTTAELKGDDYYLNGTKCFITNGEVASTFVVLAKTDKNKRGEGISGFIVEREFPGFSIGKREKKMGADMSPTNELIFENCRVPRENLFVSQGEGFKKMMGSFNGERCGNSAACVGLAQAAFERALRYSQERETFGKPIAQHQGIQWMLADMAIQIRAGRLMVYDAAYKLDHGIRAVKECAMTKAYCNEMSQRVVNQAMQIHGGYGYMEDYEVERMYRDVRGLAFGGGTPQMLRSRIAYELNRGR
jgi:alkylation response protein AidB-like acyl-CoA dehydrogenase